MFRVSIGIVEGLRHLAAHKPHPIIHRDLKPENVLLKNGTAVITDFGAARVAGSGNTAWTGTLEYSSPEQFGILNSDSPITSASDIYSFGVLLWQLLHFPQLIRSHLPRDEEDTLLLLPVIEDVKKGTPLPIGEGVPPAFAELIQQCMTMEPKQRPTAKEVNDTLRKLRMELLGNQVKQGLLTATCPAGHSLEMYRSTVWTCDSCGKHDAESRTSMACRLCDFDLCRECYETLS
jgi:serine/threonine protein kinase